MTRYFLTPYAAQVPAFGTLKLAVFLSFNTEGNHPDEKWLLQAIKAENPWSKVTIMVTIEVTKKEYNKHFTS
jgi:hypothetical protein